MDEESLASDCRARDIHLRPLHYATELLGTSGVSLGGMRGLYKTWSSGDLILACQVVQDASLCLYIFCPLKGPIARQSPVARQSPAPNLTLLDVVARLTGTALERKQNGRYGVIASTI